MANKILVVAIGGNSLIKDPQHMSVPDQFRADFILREFKEFAAKGEFPRLTIICLPNRIFIRIEGRRAGDVDDTSY